MLRILAPRRTPLAQIKSRKHASPSPCLTYDDVVFVWAGLWANPTKTTTPHLFVESGKYFQSSPTALGRIARE